MSNTSSEDISALGERHIDNAQQQYHTYQGYSDTGQSCSLFCALETCLGDSQKLHKASALSCRHLRTLVAYWKLLPSVCCCYRNTYVFLF